MDNIGVTLSHDAQSKLGELLAAGYVVNGFALVVPKEHNKRATLDYLGRVEYLGGKAPAATDAGSGGDAANITQAEINAFRVAFHDGVNDRDYDDSIRAGLEAALAARQPVGVERHTAESARALADRAVQSVELIGTLAGLPSHVQGVVRSYAALVTRSCLLYDGGQPAPAAVPVDGPLSGKYGTVLRPFVAMMERELHANAGKGDRPGWRSMDRKTALLEIYHHMGKLQRATKNADEPGIAEYAADVANMAMMLVDVCGLLPVDDATHPQPAAAPTRKEPSPNWCRTCDKRPNDPAAMLCPDPFHRSAAAGGDE